MTVFIEDFKWDKTYSFNPATGELATVSDINDTKVAGYGSEIKIGFFKKKKVFVAIFPHGEALLLWIDGQQFNLRDNAITVKKTKIPSAFTSKFSVLENSNCLLSFWYTFITFESWPNDRDILNYIAKVIASSRRSIEKQFFLMNAELQGRNLVNDPSLEGEMKDFIREQLKE